MDSRAIFPVSNDPLPSSGRDLACDIELDAALIRRAEEGNVKAFEQVASHYDLVILRFLLTLTEEEEQAAELCGRTFARAYREMKRRQISLHNWLYRIAVQEWMANQRRPTQIASPSRDRREGAAQSVLEQLSSRERVVFALKVAQRLALRTVAEILQVSDETAGQVFTRAIQKLRLQNKKPSPPRTFVHEEGPGGGARPVVRR